MFSNICFNNSLRCAIKKFCNGLFFFMIAVLFSHCTSPSISPLVGPKYAITSADELRIYATALDSIHHPIYRNIIFVYDTTRILSGYALRGYDYVQSSYPGFEEETYNSFLGNNEKKFVMLSKPPAKNANVFLYSKRQGSIDDPNVYGMIRFSCVGFNKNKTQAIVFVSDYRGSQQLVEYYLTFAYKNDAWQVMSYVLIGIT